MTDFIHEKLFYNYLRIRPELFDVAKLDFFENKDIQECFKIDKDFYGKYKQIPSINQLSEILRQRKIDSFIEKTDDGISVNNSKLEKLFEDLNEYDEDWLEKNVHGWLRISALNKSLFDAYKYLQATKIDSDNADEAVEKVKDLIQTRNNFDLSFSEGLDFFNAENHFQDKKKTFTTGYSWFDMILDGGWQEKTLHVIAGPLKGGKSIVLSNIACQAIKNGFNTCVITLEMSDKKYIRRMGSNLLDINMKDYNEFSQDPYRVKEKINSLLEGDGMTLQTPGDLFIKEYPTSTASTIDIENYIKKLEEVKKIKIRLVVVDYINIMKNWRNQNSENTYLKIKQIAEDLRAVAIRNNWCIVSATQLNRQGATSSEPTIGDVSESMGLGHTVDSMVAIVSRDAIDLEQNNIVLKAIALRESGGIGSKQNFRVDFDKMRMVQEELNNTNLDSVFS